MCCSESRPAWLMVSLGAVRPLSVLQVVQGQDMTYALAVANASDGPFVQVASQTCDTCVMNVNLQYLRRTTFQLARETAAAFVRLTVTWSSQGGVGGCNDYCDWATNVYGFKAFSPGILPEYWFAAPPPSLAQPHAEESCDAGTLTFSESEMAGTIMLTGDATRLPAGTGMRGASSVLLTPPEPQRFGAVEFSHINDFAGTCKCPLSPEYGEAMYNTVRVTFYIWLGGSPSMPGEGLVISLVDARRQMPGKTGFKRGCGTRPALPEAAVSIVLDTSDSDPSCDEPGTGIRMVASLQGGDAAPLAVGSTLSMSTAAFRTGAWIPVQLDVHDVKVPREPGVTPDPSSQNASATYSIGRTWVDGVEVMDSIALRSNWPQLRAANISLESFYIVVSARTGAIGGDRHAVSGVRVQHCPDATDLENWSGLRQPHTPPPASPPWKSPPQPSQPPAAVRGTAQLGGISFGAALACTLGVLVSVAAVLHRRRQPTLEHKRTAALDEIIMPPPYDDAWLLPEPRDEPPAKQMASPRASSELQRSGKHRTSSDAARIAEFDVFLSYRRTDALLVDSLFDKLRLTGLRVFKDVDGFLAGQPFDAELIRIMRATPVFAPVITLPSLRDLGAAASGCDIVLAELLAALCLRDAGAIRLIHPLLVGPETEAGWTSLLDEPAYNAAIAALPDASSAVTVALVDLALRRAGAAPLPPHIAALSVCEAVAGVLGATPFALACPLPDLGLYVSQQYVPPIRDALR